MSEYSPTYISFSKIILQGNGDLIKEWAQDSRNPELQECCEMLVDAAGQR